MFSPGEGGTFRCAKLHGAHDRLSVAFFATRLEFSHVCSCRGSFHVMCRCFFLHLRGELCAALWPAHGLWAGNEVREMHAVFFRQLHDTVLSLIPECWASAPTALMMMTKTHSRHKVKFLSMRVGCNPQPGRRNCWLSPSPPPPTARMPRLALEQGCPPLLNGVSAISAPTASIHPKIVSNGFMTASSCSSSASSTVVS